MEQLKIIFEIVATGFITTLVAYAKYLPFNAVAIAERINIVGNVAYKHLSFISLFFGICITLLGLLAQLPIKEVIANALSFSMFALIFLLFSYSFIPPKKILNLFSK